MSVDIRGSPHSYHSPFSTSSIPMTTICSVAMFHFLMSETPKSQIRAKLAHKARKKSRNASTRRQAAAVQKVCIDSVHD